MPARGIIPTLLAAAALTLPGCIGSGPSPAERREALAAERERLEIRERLKDFSDVHAGRVMAATDRIKRATDDLEVKRRAVLWQLRSVQQMNEIVDQHNAYIALVDVLAFEARMRHIFEQSQFRQFEGIDGLGVLGEQTPIALETARALEEAAWAVAARCLSDQDQAVLRELIDDWLANANEDMLTLDRLEYLDARIQLGDTPRGGGGLLEGVASQLDQTAERLARLEDGIARLNQQAKYAHTYARWTAEVLLYEQLQQDGALAPLQTDLDNTGTSLVRLADQVDRLPIERLEALATSLESLDLPAELDLRLDRAQALLEQTRALVERVGDMGVTGELPAQLASAADAWGGTVAELNATLDRMGVDEGSLPALSGTLAAQLDRAEGLVAEMRGLTTDATALVDAATGTLDQDALRAQLDALQTRLDAVTSQAGDQGVRIVRTAALYAAGLVALIFALLFLYRATDRRPARS